MANIQSSRKDIRRIAKRTQHNRDVRSTLKTLRKRFGQAASSQEADRESTEALARKYISAVDKAAKRRILHRNKANRLKAACARRLAAMV